MKQVKDLLQTLISNELVCIRNLQTYKQNLIKDREVNEHRKEMFIEMADSLIKSKKVGVMNLKRILTSNC